MSRLKHKGVSTRYPGDPNFGAVVAKEKVHLFISMLGYLQDRLGSRNKAWLAVGISQSFHPKLVSEQLLSTSNGNKILKAYKAEKLKQKKE